MASINFTDFITVIPAAWLNETDALVWDVFNGKSTAGTNGTILRSNGTNIVNTTATYPTTTTANQLLYSSATNTIGGLTSANNSVLVTNGSGVPSLATTLPNGLTIPTATLSSATISSLATDLAIADGGTGQSTATAAFDALAPTTTTGDIIYHNGTDNVRRAIGSTNQILRVNSSSVPSWTSQSTMTAIFATTAGTSVSMTGLPSGIKKFTMTFEGVSTNGTSDLILQLGDSGGIENTGYAGGVNNPPGAASSNNSAGFSLYTGMAAAGTLYGAIQLIKSSDSTEQWTQTGILARSDTAGVSISSGSKTLSAELTQLLLTTSGGVNTFDAGSFRVIYEF